MPTKSKRLRLFGILGWILAIIFLTLAIIFLVLYLGSRPGPRNQTALEPRTALEEELRLAQSELQQLWSTQEATNRSLAEARRHWGACRNQLENMARNITMQVAEVARHEEEKCTVEKQKLQQEMSDKNQELKTVQSQIQAERDQCAAENQRMEAQLKTVSSNSAQVTVHLPGFTFLLLIFFLCL